MPAKRTLQKNTAAGLAYVALSGQKRDAIHGDILTLTECRRRTSYRLPLTRSRETVTFCDIKLQG